MTIRQHHKIIMTAAVAVLMIAATAHAGTASTVRTSTEKVYIQLSGMG